jgi:D-glycero-D-manno-heptose 1,7-bisphosphate phosphatase
MNTEGKQKAVFLDRDGTLIEEVNFLSDPEQVRLFSGTIPALVDLRAAGFKIVVVTNQSGVGRGLFGEDDVHAVHSRIQELTNGLVDAFYFCPHKPDDGCECRKPSDGMLRAAVAEFDIDLENSWIIGDKKLDVMTGSLSGVRAILVRTGYGAGHETEATDFAEFIADEIRAAANFILSRD